MAYKILLFSVSIAFSIKGRLKIKTIDEIVPTNEVIDSLILSGIYELIIGFLEASLALYVR